MPDQILSGIDLGTTKIATIVAKISDDEIEPRIFGFASVPSKGVRKGQIVDINQITEAIETSLDKAERMCGRRIEKAFVSVSGPQVNSLNSQGVVAVAQPETEITENDINRAIEAAKAISISSNREVIEVIPREYIVDGQDGIKNPLGMTGIRLEVDTHIITASLINLRNIDRCLSELGVERTAFVFAGLASSLACLTETEKELGVVLVDIGGGKTDICIYVEGALSYSTSLPIGARHITNDIAVGLRLSLESAEKVKIVLLQYEKEKKAKEKDEIDISSLNLPEGLTTISYKTVVDGIIRPRLEEIYEKIMEEIQKSNFFANIPSGVVLTGGGSLTVGVIPAARRILEMPARLGKPNNVVGLIDEVLYPQYATTVGLILYGREYFLKKEKINLGDFSRVFKDFKFSGSFKKITDFFKSFLP